MYESLELLFLVIILQHSEYTEEWRLGSALLYACNCYLPQWIRGRMTAVCACPGPFSQLFYHSVLKVMSASLFWKELISAKWKPYSSASYLQSCCGSQTIISSQYSRKSQTACIGMNEKRMPWSRYFGCWIKVGTRHCKIFHYEELTFWTKLQVLILKCYGDGS